jgi:hypothetical protein
MWFIDVFPVEDVSSELRSVFKRSGIRVSG